MRVLLDTNIISELGRLRPNEGVAAWAAQESAYALSAVSVDKSC